jgi:hypothetical protein
MGSNEVLVVHETAADFTRLAEADLDDLADGLSHVLRLYERLGFLSFNWTLFSVHEPSNAGFNCLLRMVNRQNPYPNYRNDDYFLQKLLQTEIILTLPEDLAQEARTHFQRCVIDE